MFFLNKMKQYFSGQRGYFAWVSQISSYNNHQKVWVFFFLKKNQTQAFGCFAFFLLVAISELKHPKMKIKLSH